MAPNTLWAELGLKNRRAIQSAHKATAAIKTFGTEGEKSTDRVATSTEKLSGTVIKLVGAYAGMAGVRAVLRSLREETERIDVASRSAADAVRSVLALTAVAGRRPQVQQQMMSMAARSGRELEEVSRAYFTLLGGTAGMDPKRQAGLMQQALQFAKTEPTAGLDPLVNLFTTMASQQPGMSPRQISNVLSQTIERAKSTTEEMAQSLPGILSVAQAGKVPVTTPLAMFSFATRKGGGVAASGTAVRATMLGLIRPPKDIEKQLVAKGFNPKATMMEKIQWLAEQGEELPEQLQAALGGRRGIQAISAIAAAPEEFAQEQQLMQRAMQSKGDLVGQRLSSLFAEVPAQRSAEQTRQLESLIRLEDVKPKELKEQAVMKLRELYRRKNAPALLRGFGGFIERTTRDILGEPGEPATRQLELMESMLEAGFEPADIMKFGLPYLEDPDRAGGAPTLEGLRGVIESKGGSIMQKAPGASVSIGVQYNYTPGQAGGFLSKQQSALVSPGGIA